MNEENFRGRPQVQAGDDQSCLKKSLEIAGAGVVAGLSGSAIGYVNMLTKDMGGAGTYANFLARHILSGLGAGTVFALLGTAFKFADRYYQVKGTDEEDKYVVLGSDSTLSAFVWEHKGEIAATFASLLIVGNLSFGLCTGAREFFTSEQGIKLESMIADMLAFLAGMGTFAGCNFVLAGVSEKIQLDWEKLWPVAGALLGYIAGIHLTDVLSPEVDEFVRTWFVDPLVAPAAATVGAWVSPAFAAVGSVVSKSCLYGYGLSQTIFAYYSNRTDEFSVNNGSSDDEEVTRMISNNNRHSIDLGDNKDDGNNDCFGCWPTQKSEVPSF